MSRLPKQCLKSVSRDRTEANRLQKILADYITAVGDTGCPTLAHDGRLDPTTEREARPEGRASLCAPNEPFARWAFPFRAPGSSRPFDAQAVWDLIDSSEGWRT